MTRGPGFGRSGLWRSPIPWLGGLLGIYLALPFAGLLAQLTSGHVHGFATPSVVSALWVSVLTATMTTTLCALLGVPLAYALAHTRGRLGTVAGVVVLLPLAMPPLVAGILLVSVFGPNTALGQLFGGHLTDSIAGIVLAQTFVAAPFTVIAARSAFAAVDPSLLDVCTTLGLRRWPRFTRVSLPLARRGIGAGLVLTWLRAFGEFGATIILAYHPYSLPVFTYVRFGGFGLDQAMAPTVLSLVVAVAVGLLTRPRLRPRRTRSPDTLVPPATPAKGPERAVEFDLDRRIGDFHLRLAYRGHSPHLAILGPSGAGKTSTLRCLAGLLGPGVGRVRLDGRDLSNLPSEERHLGYVPQEPSLLPHVNLWRQLTFAPGADPRLASYWIRRLGLAGLEDRSPDSLSGGQRQRVALARALSRSPDLMLLDEPLAALDTPVRAELRRELREVQRGGGFASVLVTHDPEEAAMLAEEILVIEGGQLLQAGPRSEVFTRPATPRVARLLGISNILRGRIAAPGWIAAASVSLRVAGGHSLPTGTPVLWCVRPEHLHLSPVTRGVRADGDVHDATVLDAVDLGALAEMRIALEGDLELVVRAPVEDVRRPGECCTVEIPPHLVTAWATE